MSSRRISPGWFALALLALTGTLTGLYRAELRWASRELPRLLGGDVGAPIERRLYRHASAMLRDGERLDQARAMLERSLEIDPTCEAGYWLAEYYLRVGRADEALRRYLDYIEIDPTIDRAYLQAAGILAGGGQIAEARRVLERGRAYFEAEAERLRPRLDEQVEERYNDKAVDAWQDHVEAAEALHEAIERLDPDPRPSD